MNSKGKGLKRISIRILFPLIFSGAVTICIIALIMFFSDYFWDRIYDNARTDMERQLESFSYSVESEIYRMIDLVNETCYQGMKAKDYLSEEFSEELSLLYSHNRDKINSISLYDTDGEILWESGAQIAGAVDSKGWFQDAKSNIETICFGNPCLQMDGETLVQVLPVSRLVELTGNGVSSRGVLVICFFVEELYSALESYGSTAAEYCYLVDDGGEFLYHPYKKKLESGIAREWSCEYVNHEEAYAHAEMNGEQWLIGTHSIGYTGWEMVIVNSLTDIREKSFGSYQIIWRILCLAGFLMMLVDIILLNQITRPVARLSQAMKKFGAGSLDVRVTEDGIGELRFLETGFNIMSGKIQDLLERSIAQEKEKRYMERRLLQAQISPHFLYNTLDSIIWMIQGKQYEGAEKMVSLLAKFFRVALSKGEDIIPLRQEIQHAISYLGIQNIRFQDKFSFELDIDEKLMEYQCPKIMIQPILENAIYHGMENAFDDGEIVLSVREKGDDICIEVIDNGEGMTNEQIKQILAHAPVVSSGNKGSGVGVYNVDHRIKLLYGEKYGISIDSELDEGTAVRILIPKVSGSVE